MSAKKREYRPFREFVKDAIQDPKTAAEYLNAAQAERDSQVVAP